MEQNRGIPCKVLKSLTTTYYFYFIIIFWITFHNLKVHIVDIWFTQGFYEVRGEVIWGKFWPLSQLRPETGEPLATFKNHSQLPNMFIFPSLFGSLYHHFKVSSFQGPQSWYLIHSRFYGVRGEVLGKIVCHWGSYSMKQGNTLQNLKITHNYLIFLFYHHFLINFLII